MAGVHRSHLDECPGEALLAHRQSMLYARDLSELLAQEKARGKELKEAYDHLAAVMDTVEDGIVSVNGKGEVLTMNSVFSRMFDVTPKEAAGATLEGLLKTPEFEVFLQDGLIRRGEQVPSRVWEGTLTGSRTIYRIVHRPMGQNHHLLSFQDVTHKRRVESLKQEFLGLLSHELRTPLNGILGFANLLADLTVEEGSESARQNLDIKEYAGAIHQSGKRMLATINELLHFSCLMDTMRQSKDAATVESEEDDVNVMGDSGLNFRERVDLGETLQRVRAQMSDLAEQRGVKFHVHARESGVFVRGNAWALRECIQQLSHNAITCVEEGGVVHLDLRVVGEHAVVAVRDNGPGIPQAEQVRIFDSFYQVEHFLTRRREGLGLGLSIAKHVAELHNGFIQVKSTPGRGTTMLVKLPLRPSTGSE